MSNALKESIAHLDTALTAHADGKHAAVKRSIELARATLSGALSATGHDSIANPSAAMGTQNSAGQGSGESGRHLTAEQIRLRDQLAGCEAGYRAKTTGLPRRVW